MDSLMDRGLETQGLLPAVSPTHVDLNFFGSPFSLLETEQAGLTKNTCFWSASQAIGRMNEIMSRKPFEFSEKGAL